MTEKQFQYNVNKNIIECDGKFVAYVNCVDGTRIANKLNELVDENEQLKSNLIQANKESNNCFDLCRDLKKENEQLKKSYTELKHRHSLLHDVCIEAECDRDSYQKDVSSLEKENEQLKKDVEYWKQVASQYSNELNVFEHCKKYKTECKDIHWSSD